MTDDVQSRLSGGLLPKECLIWGQGLSGWMPMDTWTAKLSRIISNGGDEVSPSVWHYALGQQSFGPLTREAMVRELRALPHVNAVMIWTKGMKEWAPIFEFHDLLNQLGLNKRMFPRLELSGKVVLKGSGTTMIAPLFSLSEGGFGVTMEPGGLVNGQSFAIDLQTSLLPDKINARAEVRFNNAGVIGFRFTQISAEQKGMIHQLVNKNVARAATKAA